MKCEGGKGFRVTLNGFNLCLVIVHGKEITIAWRQSIWTSLCKCGSEWIRRIPSSLFPRYLKDRRITLQINIRVQEAAYTMRNYLRVKVWIFRYILQKKQKSEISAAIGNFYRLLQKLQSYIYSGIFLKLQSKMAFKQQGLSFMLENIDAIHRVDLEFGINSRINASCLNEQIELNPTYFYQNKKLQKLVYIDVTLRSFAQ